MRKWSKSSKFALLISLSVHIVAFFILRGTALYSSILNNLPKSLHIDLINVPKDSSILPNMFNKKIEMIERKWTPAKRTTKAPADVFPMKIASSEIPRRQINTKIENTPNISALSVTPNVSSQNFQSNPIPVNSFSGSTEGALSQGQSIGRGSGNNELVKSRNVANSGKIIPMPQHNTSIADLSVSKKLEIFKDSEMPFVKAFDQIGNHIVKSKIKKIDVTFIIDISESMQDDIDSIRRHLNRLIESFKEENLDYTIGVVTFHYNMLYDWLGTDIEITEQTHDVEEIRNVLRNIKVSGGERQFDAIMKAFSKVKFRSSTGRHFIFVTDEYVKGTYSASDVLKEAKRSRVVVDVIGMDEPFQRAIAEQTGGLWMPIEETKLK